MNQTAGWLLPAIAGLVYALGATILKIAITRGGGPWRAAFLSNLLLAVVMQGFWFRYQGESFDWWQAGWPILAGFTFFLGQVATFQALQSGHVSVATPLLGSKVLWITVMSAVVLRQPVPVEWWAGALLALIGIGILGYQPRSRRTLDQAQLPTIFWSLASAVLFAATDLTVQEASTLMPPDAFLPILFASQGLFSLIMTRFFRSPLRLIPRDAWPWLLVGAALIAAQGICMAIALTWFGKAAEINIIYNTRGLWSVVLAICVGRWLGLGEADLQGKIMVTRVLGAGLLLAAIWVVV